MKLQENVSLCELTTMRLGGPAAFVATVTSRDDLAVAVAFARSKNLRIFTLGTGSNVIAGDRFDGLIILNKIKGVKILGDNQFHVGAGEILDDICALTVKKNLYGMECMSGIPGTIGAAPVQNAGAYGQDISQVVTELDVYDLQNNQFTTISRADAQFSYRHSIFNDFLTKGRYIITGLTIHLPNTPVDPENIYPSLKKYLDEQKITDYTPKTLRQAVLTLRASKLPPVTEIPSAGSFFKNPILDPKPARKFRRDFPEAPFTEVGDRKIKLFAGWLLDDMGLRGHRSHGMQLYSKNALIATNKSATNLDDLRAFAEDVIEKVYVRYGVRLEMEPEVLE
jgi:UDP-N-acetylmuramate dehydrogenase